LNCPQLTKPSSKLKSAGIAGNECADTVAKYQAKQFNTSFKLGPISSLVVRLVGLLLVYASQKIAHSV